LNDALNRSGLKEGSFSKQYLAAVKMGNLSVASANNKSIINVAKEMSNSQNMSSRMSSRLSLQSKRKLIALQSASKKE
jgi:hypothetical protein